jgi:ABC-type glycerol-3-phosphate transport system permease component
MPRKTLSWPLAIVLVIAVVITLFPIFWIVMTALKPPTDWNAAPAIWVPSHPTIVNFRTLFDPDAIREYGVGGVSQAATAAVRGSLLASIVATGHPVRAHVSAGRDRGAVRHHLFQRRTYRHLCRSDRDLCRGDLAVFDLDAEELC